MQIKIILRLSILVLTLGLVFASLAFAYILPARHYLRKASQKRSNFPRLQIWLTHTRLEGGRSTQTDERLYIQHPGQIRWERLEKARVVEARLWKAQDEVAWKAGASAQTTRRQPMPLWDLFGIQTDGTGFSSLTELLSAYQIRYLGSRAWERDSDYKLQTHVSLQWFDRGPAIVFGAPSGDLKPNQLWLDKNLSFPVRLLVRLAARSPALDIHYLDYYRRGEGAVFPGRIEVYQASSLTDRYLVYRVETPQSFPARVFEQVP